MPVPIDYTGQQFHQLTALCFTGKYARTSGGNRKRIWQFQCTCGVVCEKVMEKVVKGDVKSCGCRKGKYQGIESLQYAVYTQGNYNDADITLEEFLEMSQQDCFYCGSSVQDSGSIHRARNNLDIVWQYHGLDRLNNFDSHTRSNCVTACWNCNEFKRGRSFAQFMNKVISIYNRRIQGNNDYPIY